MTQTTLVSAIVPVTEGADDVAATYRAYKRGLQATGLPYEVVYVVDGGYRDLVPAIKELKDAGEPITIITFPRPFGEAAALTAAFQHTRGDVLLTLPAYPLIDPEAIPRLIEALGECDMVVARRWPRQVGWFKRWQSKLFHLLLRVLMNSPFHDLGLGVRAFRRRVLEDVRIYGDQHRFLPLIALSHGFVAQEMNVAPAAERPGSRTPALGVYPRRLLDVLAIYFLTKFTRKPLRFFGLIGGSILLIGALIMFVLFIERVFLGVGLADRPILLLGSLLVVLGIQIIAVGLIGEIIIFAFAGEQQEYRIERIIAADEAPPPALTPALAGLERERASS